MLIPTITLKLVDKDEKTVTCKGEYQNLRSSQDFLIAFEGLLEGFIEVEAQEGTRTREDCAYLAARAVLEQGGINLDE